MVQKIAFMGFRHGHILGLYELAKKTKGIEIVGACEEDDEARAGVSKSVELTHESYQAMLDEVDCDIVATGDYYSKRGSIMIEALGMGKHVIGDKPLCTKLSELDEIERLARENGLSVGCQLDMVYLPCMRCIGGMIESGRLGEIHQIIITGQHPLSYGTRPGWYFEKGKHGGTINDIAIHAVHLLPWLTGLKFESVIAARTWNAFADEVPFFDDSAQFMLEMDNGCGVMMDVSYSVPSSQGYGMPQYWRSTFFGTNGVAETANCMDHVMFFEEGSKELKRIEFEKKDYGNYLSSMLDEIVVGGGVEPMRTVDIIEGSRMCLRIQQAADRAARDVKL